MKYTTVAKIKFNWEIWKVFVAFAPLSKLRPGRPPLSPHSSYGPAQKLFQIQHPIKKLKTPNTHFIFEHKFIHWFINSTNAQQQTCVSLQRQNLLNAFHKIIKHVMGPKYSTQNLVLNVKQLQILYKNTRIILKDLCQWRHSHFDTFGIATVLY